MCFDDFIRSTFLTGGRNWPDIWEGAKERAKEIVKSYICQRNRGRRVGTQAVQQAAAQPLYRFTGNTTRRTSRMHARPNRATIPRDAILPRVSLRRVRYRRQGPARSGCPSPAGQSSPLASRCSPTSHYCSQCLQKTALKITTVSLLSCAVRTPHKRYL